MSLQKPRWYSRFAGRLCTPLYKEMASVTFAFDALNAGVMKSAELEKYRDADALDGSQSVLVMSSIFAYINET